MNPVLLAFKKAHLVGIGGINVSAIAKLLLHYGIAVSGADRTESEIITELRNCGIPVRIGGSSENIKQDAELLIYSDAVSIDNVERATARQKGVKEMSAFQFWGHYAADKKVIAISGTNGKSTTTAMIGLILEAAGFDPTVVVGARVWQWNSNLRIGMSDWLVIEADEYHDHMLEFKPYIAVITNIAADHLDYYKDLTEIISHFQRWLDRAGRCAGVVLNEDDPNCSGLRSRARDKRKFSLKNSGLWPDIKLQVPGEFNLANALAAAEAADLAGSQRDFIVSALNKFTGTGRRFEIVGQRQGATVISDYAHHPDALKATIEAARQKYPNRRLVVLFQPHQRDRTKKLFPEFIQSLKGVENLILAEIYDVAGREKENVAISSRQLAAALPGSRYAAGLEEAGKILLEMIRPGDIVLIMGAGDVDKVARTLTALDRKDRIY